MQTTHSLITTDLNLRKDFKLTGVKKGQDGSGISSKFAGEKKSLEESIEDPTDLA